MKMLFDLSSNLWTGLSVGTDIEGIEVEHNGKLVTINSAAYGYENVVNLMVKALNEWNLTPKDMILVPEGKDSKKRRCLIEPTYKAGRSSRPPEAYLEFNTLKEKVIQTFRDLGAISVTQNFVEGDDVIGYLVKHMEEDCVVVTNDNDLIVLNGINEHGSKCFVRVNGQVAVNKYGEFDFKLVTLYKATVGDASDGIKGCQGFGPAAFLNINARYSDDGCHELMQLIATGKRDAVAQFAHDNECKYLNKIVENWDTVVRSYRLALLHPEWVNTIKQQLEWSPGMVKTECDDERLRQWRGMNRLVTADTYESALKFLVSKLHENDEVAFDIETTTSDESTDWLIAQGKPDGVDVFGSTLAGFSMTFGKNNHITYYVSVNHADSKNITMKQARLMMEACFQKKMVIQNTSFELAVLHEAEDADGSKWKDHWAIYGEKGFMPNVLDTKLEASYVDENSRLGLKDRSLSCLGYTQQSFDDTTKLEGHPFPGGERYLKNEVEYTKYKMHELPATHVFGYGADDTICTAALHNYYKLIMHLEHCWDVYLDVEIDAAYLHAQTFCDGVDFSLAKMKELEGIDKVTLTNAWAVVRKFLMDSGWNGTVPPVYTAAITAKEIKEAYAIVMGLDAEEDEDDAEEGDDTYHADAPIVIIKDPIISTRTRIPAKFPALLRAEGHDDFAELLEGCLAGRSADFTAYVCRHFTGEPKFKASNKMMCKLLYETMKLPIKVRNKPTAKMKESGVREGNPKADALAIAYAIRDASVEQVAILESLKLMQMVKTRIGLYYSKYPYFLHWRDGKIRSSHNQCATNTRRASSSAPNMQQLPKNAKIEGYPARFRETIVPHKRNAVIVSMDFMAQELRVIADYSQDKNMLACFVGDSLKDMHALTGLGIIQKTDPKGNWTYETFMEVLGNESHPDYKKVKDARRLGKATNFSTEFGAAAPKLASVLLVSETDAQAFIDARESAFSESSSWKKEVVDEAKTVGYVRTKLGAVRHLATLLNSDDRFISSKAERQAVNFKVQSSSAEMTKLAESRMWRDNLFSDFDAVCYGPIHDEIVASVALVDLQAFLIRMHKSMVSGYADMTVPIKSSISFGESFGVQAEQGECPLNLVPEATTA